MKTILALLLALSTLASAQTSEPILFTAHLTGVEPADNGEGMFSLIGNRFTYHVRTPFGFSLAAIYGPALPGAEGPLIFELPTPGCVAPPPDGGDSFCLFAGHPPGTGAFILSEQQSGDLFAGLWYVRATSPGAPSFPTRGQILQVPEPSVLSFVLTAGAGAVGLKHALTRAGQKRTVQVVHKKPRDRQPREC